MSTVYVRVQVGVDNNTNSNDLIIQSLHGWSDAHFSRGLVSVMAECITHASLKDVLDYGDNVIPHVFQEQSMLSPGRNNGWKSLYHTIRQQLVWLQQEHVVSLSSAIDDTNTEHQPPDIQPSTTTTPTTTPAATIATTTSTSPPKKQVALLLSGGVDSSVALHLLLQNHTQYNVTAFYLKIWLEDELAHLNVCPWQDDIAMCQQVCAQANVSLHILSLQDEYRERVIAQVLAQAQAGRTPNPDILCNSHIKMGVFWQVLMEQQQHNTFDLMATGHYAQVDTGRLWRAPDPVKDQSYFLCALTAQQLQRVLFPIGHLQKSQVRQLAHEWQLPTRNRKDSQGLCFLGKVKFDEFLSCYLGDSAGEIVDAMTGQTIGHHRGLHFHTVGQRKGIGKVLNPLATSQGPWYVVAKDTALNTLYCSNQYDDEAFAESRSRVTLEDLHWIHDSNCPADGEYDLKIRHGARLARGHLQFRSESNNRQYAEIQLENKDSGLAPGQTIAIYNRTTGECLGCGIISERQWIRFLKRQQRDSHYNKTLVEEKC